MGEAAGGFAEDDFGEGAAAVVLRQGGGVALDVGGEGAGVPGELEASGLTVGVLVGPTMTTGFRTPGGVRPVDFFPRTRGRGISGDLKPLTQEIVSVLNPEVTLGDLAKDIARSGYPTTA
ncbi:hypothetical protein AB0L35_10375 [Streptomyces sp. NPDC052309]|uniref:hypothetical protein n=1 Tax=Streptomyces sp. NPDC052309 TaxID=3155421 RepID=UPI0034282768